MNNAIHDAFVNALLAEASYVEGLLPGQSVTNLTQKLSTELTAPLAEYVAQHFTVVKQTSDPASGFSVTVFQDLSTEQKYISFRGTQDVPDVVADLDIFVGQGVAYQQIKAMMNWYLRASTPEGAQAVQLADTWHMVDGQLVFNTYLTAGTGEITGSPDWIVDGHSLGGHLTTAFARLFGNAATRSFTYNGCGFRANADSIFSMIERSLGMAATAYPGPARQTNVFAEHGVNIATTDSLWISQFGQRLPVFDEQGTAPSNHRMYKLTDALALCDVMGTIDEQLSLSDATRILDAGSANAPASLEMVLDALRRLCRTPDTTPTQIGDAPDAAASRVDYQTKLAALRGLVEGDPALRGQIVSLTGADAVTIETNAFADIGYRYALGELNAFAIVGDASIYSQHNANSQLDIYNSATESGTLTTQWIADRAEMLSWTIVRNNADIEGIIRRTDGGESKDFVNFAVDSQTGKVTKEVLLVRGGTSLGKLNLQPQVAFGSSNSDGLNGSGFSDKLYGGDGKDTLVAQGGDDYLEGGQGDDLLNGGYGNDTYMYLGKEGDDTIVDADGVGKILYAGRDLSGAKTLFDPAIPDVYTDGAFTYRAYTHAQNTILTVTKDGDPSGKITVQNFRNGDLGITLDGTATPPQTTSKFGTDEANLISADAPNQNVFGLGGNDRITVATANASGYGGLGIDVIRDGDGDQKFYGEDGNDALIATAGYDELYGGPGNDALQGGADGDYLEGNDGDDALDGGAGGDTIYGGAGADFILGGGSLVPGLPDSELVDPSGPNWGMTVVNGQMVFTNMAGATNIDGEEADYIDGGAGNDVIAAGDGDDYVDGGADDDLLVGQAGNDTLLGGAGNDTLFGDGTQGSVTFGGGQQLYTLPASHGDDYLDGGDGNDNLTGDGGADTLLGGIGDDILIGDDSRLDEQYHGADYLDGGDGNDRLFGQGKDDMLFGGAGDDFLEGDGASVPDALAGNDYLDGGDGNDWLQGDGGNDTLFGGAGDDQLHGDTDDTPLAYQGNDYLDGEDGNDYLRGYGGNDQLFGGEGNDQLLGEAGDDYLDGVAGDDQLFGGLGDDMLDGGAGADILAGGAGDDTYIVDMNDTVDDTDGNNTIIFATDVNPDQLQITPVDYNGMSTLVLSAGGAANGELVPSGLTLNGIPRTQNFQFQFNDGTVLSQAELYGSRYFGSQFLTAGDSGDILNGGAGEDTLIGGAGGDTIYGWDGNDNLDGGAGEDTLVGGRGNDELRGGNGSDTYVFSRGSGQDTVLDFGDLQNIDTLRLADVLQNDVTLDRMADGNLQIRVNGTDDRITVQGQYTLPDNRIEQIVFADGTGIGAADLQALQVAPITGTSQDDALVGTPYDDTLLGLAGNDTLDGGAGNDRLEGGDGQDIYLMRYGMGSDVAVDASPEGSVVRLQPGLELSDLAATRQGEDLLLQIRGMTDGLRIQGYYAAPQTWSIEDAAGHAATPHDLLDATARATQYQLDPIWNDFLARTRSSIITGYANVGYDLTADGTLHRESTRTEFSFDDPSWWASLGAVGATYTIATTVTTNTLSYFPGYSGAGIPGSYQTSSNSEYWSPATRLTWALDTTISIDKIATISDDPIIQSNIGSVDWQGFSAHTDSESDGGAAWLKVDWGDSRSRISPKFGTQVVSTSYTSFVYDVDGNVAGSQLTNVAESSITTNVTGRVTGVLSDPVSYRTDGAFPEAIPTARIDHHRSELIEEIKAGSSDNVIYAGPRTLVDGGEGDDTIYGGGVAYGGAGNDRLEGGGIQLGGAGNDTLINGSIMIGGEGNDTLIGGNVMIGGDGNDRMFGGPGSATFAINASDTGVDLIGSAASYANYVLDDFYQSHGIPDWSERYSYGGMYSYSETLGRVTMTFYKDEQEMRSVADGWGLTLEQAIEQGRTHYHEPLPVVALAAGSNEPSPFYAQSNIPVVHFSANDFQALAPYYANGIIPKDRVVFGEGVSTSDIVLSWGQVTAAMSGRDTDPASLYTTLNISWGSNQGVQVLIPHSDDPLGTGVEEFEFADGTKLGMADMIALAPTAPTFDPQLVQEFLFQPGMGVQTADTGIESVRFAAGIQPEDVTVTRAGADLLLTYNNGTDALRVPGWYSDPALIPSLSAIFDSGTTWDAATLTAQGLVMHGTAGADTLTALSPYSNVLIGGPGNDTLIGGTGNDTYVFNLGDGIDRISDPGGNDALQFGSGITPDALSLGIGSLLIHVGTGGDAVHLETFDPNDVYGFHDIENFQFADGTMLTYAQLIERGFDLAGTDGSDILNGTNVVDRIHGAGGDDVITGGAGNDELFGGAGDDTYVFRLGDGLDTIHDAATFGAENLIEFGAGVTRNDLVVEHEGNTLTIRYGAAGDAIRLPDFNAHNVNGTAVAATLKFADGSTASLAQLANRAPTLANALADQDAIEDSPFSVQLPVNAFVDVDVGDTLTYDATLADGSALPGWLAFDAATRTFSGMPARADVGALNIKVTATDSGNLSALDIFGLTIAKIPGQILVGTDGNDVLSGGGGDDTLDGRGGSDRLLGNGGDDTFQYFADAKWTGQFVAHNEGSPGNRGTERNAAIAGKNRSYDVFQGGPGTDVLIGTSGDDALFLDDRYSPFPSGREPRLSGIESIEGGSGSDVIDLTSTDYGYGDVTLDGGEGNDVLWASGGNDILSGGPGNDDLFGGAGNDELSGGTGADTMNGGAGNDTYVVDNPGDVVTENAGAGIDTVQSSINYTVGSNVENLTLTGESGINGTGNTLGNVITGNGAANTLNGGAGADTMSGGAGDDTYLVDNAGDIVTENVEEGIDLVQSSVTYTLAANVENLTLMGAAAISGTGNTLDNELTGNRGANTLNGDAGADTLIGGLGNDTYVVDNAVDNIVENLNEGTDLVQSSVSYSLAANVEKLTLTGTAATTATGNELNNTLTGNSSGNLLDGMAGADAMIGGAGDDTYVVDNAADVVTEGGSAGVDTVNSSVTYALAGNVENLTLTGGSTINGTGNTLNNVIIGNSAANTLNGGAGADTLIGGLGDDVYTVDNAFDVVTENATEGFDTINSSVTRTISANVEKLVLTGTSAINGTGSAGDDYIVGNTANNTLTGGAGNDLLNAGAGAGADTLKGDAGNDVLEGMNGNDTLADTGGNNLFNGGAGTDTMTGNSGNELFIGGAGNDTITVSTGKDIIAFNRGDGQDTINASTGADNTLSIGGGIRYADMTFTRNTNNLVLNLGGSSEKVTLANWYSSSPANKSVLNLQVIAQAMANFNASSADPLLNKNVANFDFLGLASAFDAAGAPANWALTHALLAEHLSGSDTEALGGDLAYRYGLTGSLANVGFDPAGSLLSNASFGTAAQAFQSQSALEQGIKRLS